MQVLRGPAVASFLLFLTGLRGTDQSDRCCFDAPSSRAQEAEFRMHRSRQQDRSACSFQGENNQPKEVRGAAYLPRRAARGIVRYHNYDAGTEGDPSGLPLQGQVSRWTLSLICSSERLVRWLSPWRLIDCANPPSPVPEEDEEEIEDSEVDHEVFRQSMLDSASRQGYTSVSQGLHDEDVSMVKSEVVKYVGENQKLQQEVELLRKRMATSWGFLTYVCAPRLSVLVGYLMTSRKA